jgi:hypothetical protein
MRIKPRDRAIVVLALFLAACKGTIQLPSGAHNGNGNGNGSGSGSSGGPGQLAAPLRRLTATEYNNTVRDLLGAAPQSFPPDTIAPTGFDNDASLLGVDDALMTQYESTADQLLAAALYVPHPLSLSLSSLSLAKSCDVYDCGQHNSTPYVEMWAADAKGLVTTLPVQDSGVYQISIQAFQSPANYTPLLSASVDGSLIGSWTVTAVEVSPGTYQATVNLHAGQHQLQILNASPSNTYQYDLMVGPIAVSGPTPPGTPSPQRAHLLDCGAATAGSQACAQVILGRFAQRAWRRPVTADELTRLYGLVTLATQQNDTFEAGIQLALKAVLLSPNFLFRVEVDPDPTSTNPHPLSDYELATRLSYFLWSSMPDDTLFQAAQAGTLHDPATLLGEVDRMLADPKAQALTDNFAAPWLNQRALALARPDATVYPSFDEALRGAMAAETQAFFQDFLANDESALDMMDAPFAYLNQRLASEYQLSGSFGSTVEKVMLDRDATHRGGLLTQASILTASSIATRSSIARRGKWVLTDLLCSAPPPPPPGVPPLPATPPPGETLRQQMEQHATTPACAGCHNVIDPIGFGLENYDGIGAWRTTDQGSPIDASGTTSAGQRFTGPQELAAIIKSDPRLPACMVQKFFIYAFGRDVAADDSGSLSSIGGGFAGSGYRLKALIHQLVVSAAFTTRQASGQ